MLSKIVLPFSAQCNRPLQDYAQEVDARRASVPEVLVSGYLMPGMDNPPYFHQRDELVYQPFPQLVERLQLREGCYKDSSPSCLGPSQRTMCPSAADGPRWQKGKQESWGSSSEASNPEPEAPFTTFLQPTTRRVIMQKRVIFFPGRVKVAFRKGPLGYLLQDPTDQARTIKNNLSLQDKSAPIKLELVRQNALNVVRQRGGDASDQKEVFGEYILQFGKYKGKSFRWLLENDVGYTIYLMKNLQQEEAAGVTMTEGHSKSSLVSFMQYAHSFEEILSLLHYTSKTPAATAASPGDDQLVGFGARAKSTWKEIWDGRADGYASFVMGAKCVRGTRMHKLQQYLLKQQQSARPHVPATSEPTEMDEDAELETAMLNITPSKLLVQSPASSACSAAEVKHSTETTTGFYSL
ncbi:uncharacterized protein LOC130416213 [Triplophysa dalaica]|uniref:uncharacterized protein LOC130416213 n=1 Tax=Triplophysa dalaica TaxID=1582913 RepID=UPI0024DF5FCB|nr:uncharacterized protein LOC130416213 [Triplophysa dalaica]